MSWRFIFLIIVLYFLYRSLKKIFFSATGRNGSAYSKRRNDPYYDNITDQKIEDIEFEEVENEDKE
ncbi:MAG: hypothetical protein R6U43_09215 [Candidatus Krumholzibacteriales bacterium]